MFMRATFTPVVVHFGFHFYILAAAAIREASSSMSQLEKCTKINHKIETPSAKARKSVEGNSKDSKKERLDRYRPAILYDDDDENTSKPKQEKLINQDKERIELERKQQLDKKKTKKDTPREEKSKQKMETSADKFKTFLSADSDDKSPNEPNTSNANVSCVEDTDDDVVEVKGNSPAKVDLSDSPEAARSKSPDPEKPRAWKVKNKRQSTSNAESASKRSRRISSSSSSSPERDSSNNVQIDRILRDVVFVISGIQVNISLRI